MAALYEMTFPDVQGDATTVIVTVCSPDPNGDSFGVGSIATTALDGCVDCTLTVNVPNVSICEGESTTLTANPQNGDGSYSYNWSTGGTGASITVSPTVTTTYYVTVTDGIGCTATDEVTVTVNDNPVASITCDDGSSSSDCQIVTYSTTLDLSGNVSQGECVSNGLCGGEDFSSTVYPFWTDELTFT